MIPFGNGADCFTSESLTIENGIDSLYIRLEGNFGRNLRDLKSLKQAHDFLGRAIAAIESIPELPADEPSPKSVTLEIKRNPLIG